MEGNKKIIVFQDGAGPYKNEFSNSGKKNIVWGVLQEPCLSTDGGKNPIYYSPQFLKEKATDFIGKNLVLNHQDDCVVGRGIDVVFNNNGIIASNGDVLPADSRLWYCAEVDEGALKKYGVGIDELCKCGFSTSFTNAELTSIGDSVNGLDFAEDVKLVAKADVVNMSLLAGKSARFNICKNLYNSTQFDEKEKNFSALLDLNCDAKKQVNDSNMADEVKENKTSGLTPEDLEKIKEIVKGVVDARFAEKEQLKNDNCEEKKEDIKNSDDEIKAKLDEINAKLDKIMEAKKEAEKKEEIANDDEVESKSNEEARNLMNSKDSCEQNDDNYLLDGICEF